MINDEQVKTIETVLSTCYAQSKDDKQYFMDHNFPTPHEIVKFVEDISKETNIMAERNIEWVLNNKVSTFLSECPQKHQMLETLKNDLGLKVEGTTSRDLNIAKAQNSMNYNKIGLRTNYPFISENTGDLRANIWPEALQKDWWRGYRGIECLIPTAWANADTSNTGSTNLDARNFILPKLNFYIWNDVELFKPHAYVETCTISISRDAENSNTYEVYGSDFKLLYVGDKTKDNYIYKNKLVRTLVRLQQVKFGKDYMKEKSIYYRNQHPTKSVSTPVRTFSIDKDGNAIKEKKVSKVDKNFGMYRLGFTFMRNSTPWFNAIRIYQPDEAVCTGYNEYASPYLNEVESLESLLRTKFANIVLEDTMYGRGNTPATMKFIGKFPLDRIWNDKLVLKFLGCKDYKLLDEIEKRFNEGFDTSTKTVRNKNG